MSDAGSGALGQIDANDAGALVDDTDTTAGRGFADALAEVDGLADRPLDEHASVYESLHGQLRSALADIDGA